MQQATVTGICPLCHQVGYKVSALVAQGQTRVSVSGPVYHRGIGYFSGDGIVSTELAERLAMPPMPQFEDSRNCLSVFTLIMIISGVMTLLFVVLFAAAISAIGSNSLTSSNLSGQTITIDLVAVLMVAAIPTIIILYLRTTGKINSQKRLEINQKLPYWSQLYKVWDTLFYCFHNDIVFIPNTDLWAEAAHWRRLVNFGAKIK